MPELVGARLPYEKAHVARSYMCVGVGLCRYVYQCVGVHVERTVSLCLSMCGGSCREDCVITCICMFINVWGHMALCILGAYLTCIARINVCMNIVQ